MGTMQGKVLVANRGVVACRIFRTAKRLGLSTVAVYSPADQASLHVRMADEAVALSGNSTADSYLDGNTLLGIATAMGVGVIHPGYGFLSENPQFAAEVEAAGLAFAGPTAEQMKAFAKKEDARRMAQAQNVPLLPGSELLDSPEQAVTTAEKVGYPVMLKSSAGGGGIGMQVCRNATELGSGFESVKRLGQAHFGSADLFLERYIERARHVEVQIFGDGRGRVVTLGERDCSLQRRNQKVIEETPAPGLSPVVRESLAEAAKRLGEAVGYRSAGTVEFLYDPETEQFFFLEVNTRLQVEHGVTEEVYGVDLVEWMLRGALGDWDFFSRDYEATGVSAQARLYAESPALDFQPRSGVVSHWKPPENVRVETWVEAGTEVSPHYDPMLAKIIVHSPDRRTALTQLQQALTTLEVDGVEHNADYLIEVLGDERVQSGQVYTRLLSEFNYRPAAAVVLDGGIETLVVDWPGRTGYWHVGVPPSGPFDDLSFRLCNVVLGNEPAASGLEFAVRGPSLRFLTATEICLGGADFEATLDGKPVALYQVHKLSPGSVLSVGTCHGPGLRGYLAWRGGLEVPEYLGSTTTFRLGQFGGYHGRAVLAGDLLRWKPELKTSERLAESPTIDPPKFVHHWLLGVAYGPHGAPDFFTPADIDAIFSTNWEVHYNSARTGVRLIGPKPEWARKDGGEAGLHPSNLHDNAYQVGAIDFTGDMPIILGPDGPSLGGFVCPGVVLQSELWKVGQLRPGDTVRFFPVTLDSADTHRLAVEEYVKSQASIAAPLIHGHAERLEPVVLGGEQVGVCYRRQGDCGLLVEYGPMALDLGLRLRVQSLYEALRDRGRPGLLDLTPGIRSLQVRYDPAQITIDELVSYLEQIESALPAHDQLSMPSRRVYLPLCWDDPSTRLAIQRYMQSVRPDAPWCPDNIEFIRRINGLDSREEVQEIVFAADYLVMGLGDVYLGAPVATPLDPRHRLVTTKYNPARTWTPENAVGIGGAYMCIYGMEGPGGYQFVGRTVPVWNRYRKTHSFSKPWLLRFFDRIRFYPVTSEELGKLRLDILTGVYEPECEPGAFTLHDYEAFLETEKMSIDAFRKSQRQAFEEERARWASEPSQEEELATDAWSTPGVLSAGQRGLLCPTAGAVWKVLVEAGDEVQAGQDLVVIESMKMEIHCPSPCSGRVHEICVTEGRSVRPGEVLLCIQEAL